ncbi:hypothetical protein HG536_0C04590 [Torulaspora globosa]|uniref:BZIP domain-containing protein n=1 Tax=Torulaspora globosa TaxID=48254 RepID=A0A7G3ZFK4_9SACH|nr:uncharacterized protein HG536_0C04590 [Torulaspora globosa]QLL32290.1 hypothetical protein HG536_0C04590 [Torulaspora globosa]
MINEQERHVHHVGGPIPIGYRTAGGGCSSAAPQQLPHAPVEQQAPYGDALLQSGFLGTENGGGEAANGIGNGHRWHEGDPRNISSAMYHSFNQHMLTDPLIQENLSPFFQPFGVDASHLPLTNPPIFQSSLTRFDEPVRRRRISISNGQISQLGEDLETVENLYNTQPPPLPQRFDHQAVKPQFYEPATAATDGEKNGFMHMRDEAGIQQKMANSVGKLPSWDAPAVKDEKLVDNLLQDTGDNRNGIPNANATSVPLPPNGIMSRTPSSSSSTSTSYYGQQNSYGSKHYRPQEPIPGTNAWKRARLLERNRIAASKCRQRKKVAQLQLQKDYDILIKENKVIKKKLDYYEKLVSKFKKFSETHLKKCSGSDSQSFSIIEEMLMIDSDIREVDNDGLVVKMEDS